jgi:hypothetical protein
VAVQSVSEIIERGAWYRDSGAAISAIAPLALAAFVNSNYPPLLRAGMAGIVLPVV